MVLACTAYHIGRQEHRAALGARAAPLQAHSTAPQACPAPDTDDPGIRRHGTRNPIPTIQKSWVTALWKKHTEF